MSRSRTPTGRIRFTLLLALLSACLVFSIILFPEQSFDASLHSLTVWWTIVFPALLPFLIIAEMLLAYGLFHFLGTLLQPLMRLFFRLPGTSGPVMAIGFTIGYPAGAKLTNKLNEQHDLTHAEGNLLLSLSHMASPILMINVIAVGFFHNAQLGIALTFIQIISMILTGVCLKYYTFRHPDNSTSNRVRHREIELREIELRKIELRKSQLVKSAFAAMRQARIADGRTFGKLLGDTVSTGIQTLMMIGGFMMIFAVIIQVLQSTVISQFVTNEMDIALFKGLFELHVGSFSVSETDQAGLIWQFAAISGMLAWSGLALHAQVISIVHKSGLRYSYFLLARTLHACLAIIAAIALWFPLQRFMQSPFMNHVLPSFHHRHHADHMMGETCPTLCKLTAMWSQSALLIIAILTALVALSLGIELIKKSVRR